MRRGGCGPDIDQAERCGARPGQRPSHPDSIKGRETRMSEAGFLSGARLSDLGAGAGYSIFALRACASGAGQCCSVRRTFYGRFGADGETIRRSFELFAAILGSNGRRAITLAPPGTCRITGDEMSFVAAVAAAQSGRVDVVRAHLNWLFAGPYPAEAEDAVNRAAAGLYLNGVCVESPAIDQPVNVAAAKSRPFHYSGRA